MFKSLLTASAKAIKGGADLYFTSQSKKSDVEIKRIEALSKAGDNAFAILALDARGGFLQRNWRPMLMWVIVFIIANNHLILPFSEFFGKSWVEIPMPQELWFFLQRFCLAYGAGRSFEKSATNFSKKK